MDKEFKACIDQAERFLVLREHNEKELKDKLRNKKYSEEVIEQTLSFLKEEDEISEERFIRSFIRSSNNRHPEGAKVILQRLAEKGAERTLSNEIVREIYTEEYSEELAKKAFYKITSKYSDLTKIKQKMVQAGFSLSVANRLNKDLELL